MNELFFVDYFKILIYVYINKLIIYIYINNQFFNAYCRRIPKPTLTFNLVFIPLIFQNHPRPSPSLVGIASDVLSCGNPNRSESMHLSTVLTLFSQNIYISIIKHLLKVALECVGPNYLPTRGNIRILNKLLI